MSCWRGGRSLESGWRNVLPWLLISLFVLMITGKVTPSMFKRKMRNTSPQDIDNTHVISLIERKMPKDDSSVCAGHIYVQKLEPSVTNLLRWMDKEMTARFRSGAVVQKIGSHRASVNVLKPLETYTTLKMSTETKVLAIATCVRRLIMSTSVPGSRRWRLMNGGKLWIEEQKAYFSCLKKGKGHTTANCFRMKECFENNGDGILCKKPHHKRFHPKTPVLYKFLLCKRKANHYFRY